MAACPLLFLTTKHICGLALFIFVSMAWMQLRHNYAVTCRLMLRGWALEETLARANEFAGAICAIPGAIPQDLGFYDKWVARWRAG